jgi:hypothetical protein
LAGSAYSLTAGSVTVNKGLQTAAVIVGQRNRNREHTGGRVAESRTVLALRHVLALTAYRPSIVAVWVSAGLEGGMKNGRPVWAPDRRPRLGACYPR